MTERLIIDLRDRVVPNKIGNKAQNIYQLIRKRYRVPTSHVVTWDAYTSFLDSGPGVLDRIHDELKRLIDPGLSYAVRSSANIEDSMEHSFAGQFMTHLDVLGLDNILEAIRSVWTAVQTESVHAYLKQLRGVDESLKMAVIIQEMVTPVISGVVFSKNPITALDEIVIEAVRGSGTLLVQEGVSPLRWVNKWGEWVEHPEEEDGLLDLVNRVVEKTCKISRAFGKDVDLEWVYDGSDLYWVQMRDITSLEGVKLYSNRLSKEMLPGIVKPLIWSVNIPITNGQWIRLIEEITGELDIEPTSLAKAFYYRTYFDMGTFGQIFESFGLHGESLERMMGITPKTNGKPAFRMHPRMFALMPRMIRFLYDKWRFDHKAEVELPELRKEYNQLGTEDITAMDEDEILMRIDSLYNVHCRTTYFNIVIPLLMQVYFSVLRSRLKSVDIEIDQFELTEGMDELKDFDPGVQLNNLSCSYHQFDQPTQERIISSTFSDFMQMSDIDEFQREVESFLQSFGHLSDSGTDFSYVPWRENPEILLRIISEYDLVEDPKQKQIRLDDVPYRGLSSWIFNLVYHRARNYRLNREKVSSLYTYGLGLFRSYYLALGDRFVDHKYLDERDDIFYLYDEEIRGCISGDVNGQDFRNLVCERKEEIESCADISLPEIIYGESNPPPIVQTKNVLTGTPTSRGYYTGNTKILRGINDFHKLDKGDILVIPHSDVGWTPLFSKAGAVVAESGGILSHSSIIAREYNIPAVVSVDGAMQLSDNMLVTIDGYKGKVVVHDQEGKPE